MVWPNRIKDKDVLRRLVAIIFVRITNLILYHIPKVRVEDIDYHRELYMILKLHGTGRLRDFFTFAEKFGLEKEVDPVLDDIWNINKEVQRYAYPEPYLWSWGEFKYGKDGWRKLLKLVHEHGDQTIDKNPAIPIDGLFNKNKDSET
jgi:hypothetical protein